MSSVRQSWRTSPFTVSCMRSASGSSISSSVVSHGPIGPCVSNDFPRVKVGERFCSQSRTETSLVTR
jgi:hypothetical protein